MFDAAHPLGGGFEFGSPDATGPDYSPGAGWQSNPLGLNTDFGPAMTPRFAPSASSSGPGYGTVMAAGMFANMFSTIFSGISQNQALHQQADYQQRQLNFNAKIADLQAQDAIDTGNREASRIERQGNQVLGAQRAGYGASGVDVNYGSAMDVQKDTRATTALDVLTTKNNAAKAAWGYKVQAAGYQSEGEWGQHSANVRGGSTLLTSGLQAAGEGAMGYYYGAGGTIKDSARPNR